MTETSSSSPSAAALPAAADFIDAVGGRAAAARSIASLRAWCPEAGASTALDWGRITAIALALALHLAVLVHLMVPPSAWTPASRAPMGGTPASAERPLSGLRVEFLAPEARLAVDPRRSPRTSADQQPVSQPEPEPGIALATRETARQAAFRPAPQTAEPAAAAAPPIAVANAADADSTDAVDPAPVIRLFRADGSIVLPQAVLDDLQAVESEDRMFDFMTPGLAGSATAFRRPPVVEYTPTRFDADWKPVRSIGADALVAVSEALTYENRSGTVRCSLVPPACAWGKVVAPVLLDDPNTLNPDEAAACQRLWVDIVEATQQREWLTLRQRFDAECRKPLAVDLAPPAAQAAAPDQR